MYYQSNTKQCKGCTAPDINERSPPQIVDHTLRTLPRKKQQLMVVSSTQNHAGMQFETRRHLGVCRRQGALRHSHGLELFTPLQVCSLGAQISLFGPCKLLWFFIGHASPTAIFVQCPQHEKRIPRFNAVLGYSGDSMYRNAMPA